MGRRQGGAGRGSGARPTIKDVAAKSGMSLVTVSRVLNDHPSIKPATRERVERAIRDLSYEPSAAAQSMRRKFTRTVGFLMPDFTNGVNAAIAQAVERTLREAGYSILLACSHFDPRAECNGLTRFEQSRVDGIILQSCDEGDPAIRARLRSLSSPVVLVDRDTDLGIDQVLSEHRSAMRQAVRYLHDLGHERIAFVGSTQHLRPGRERLAGYRRAVEELGCAVDESLIFAEAQSTDYGLESTLAVFARRRPPTALIAAGNQILYGCLFALDRLGLRFPDDLSLVGADHRNLSTVTTPKITLIDRDAAEIGERVARMLLDRLQGTAQAGPRQVVLPSHLILNGSCGQPPAHRPARVSVGSAARI